MYIKGMHQPNESRFLKTEKKKKHASTNFESFSYVVFVPSDFPN